MKKWILVQTFKKMISSRKFLYTCIGVLTTLLSEKLGLNPEEVKNIGAYKAILNLHKEVVVEMDFEVVED